MWYSDRPFQQSEAINMHNHLREKQHSLAPF